MRKLVLLLTVILVICILTGCIEESEKDFMTLPETDPVIVDNTIVGSEKDGIIDETETEQEATKTSEETQASKIQVTVTEPAETKPTGTKPAETKPTGTKPAETKPAETKPAETKPAETKPAETEPIETRPSENLPPETIPPIVNDNITEEGGGI